jgi:dihydroorotase-like cyclic amidohydrolase
MLGFVDDHSPTNMPFDGTLTAGDWASGTAATAAGGTTTIGDFALQEEGGALAPVADIVLWYPQLPIAATVQNRHGNVYYTPYEGMNFTGRPASVYV